MSSRPETGVSPITDIITDIKAGRMVVLVDEAERENEGDLLIAAEFVTPEVVNFMARYGRGLICLTLTEEKCRGLNLPLMFANNRSPLGTNFTVSIEAAEGVTTGISAADRARTVQVAIRPDASPSDLVQPGHIFPLMAENGGVLVRAGHTESAVDLARLAGLEPAGVICEILNSDGSMARISQLSAFSKAHGLSLITIRDLIEYRRKNERLISRLASAKLPTQFGDFHLHLYEEQLTRKQHLALVAGEVARKKNVLVRVHSSCITGDTLFSMRCDCGDQLRKAMQIISHRGRGVILYLNQEGRGIGLLNKIKAYVLQDQGLDTVQANKALGFKPDLREYGIGAQILSDLGLSSIQILTNNPRKIVGIDGYGLHVTKRVPIQIPATAHTRRYFKAKKEKLGHYLSVP